MSVLLVNYSLRSCLRGCSLSVHAMPKSNYMNKKKELMALEKIIEPKEEPLRKEETPNLIPLNAPLNVLDVFAPEVMENFDAERRVRIYLTPKNAMQSGTANVNHWELEFETRDRWENPLMGWSSSGDPLSNLKLQFVDKEDAINYAQKIGYNYFVEPEKKGKPKVKSYGFNFSWDKRSRVSTK